MTFVESVSIIVESYSTSGNFFSGASGSIQISPSAAFGLAGVFPFISVKYITRYLCHFDRF